MKLTISFGDSLKNGTRIRARGIVSLKTTNSSPSVFNPDQQFGIDLELLIRGKEIDVFLLNGMLPIDPGEYEFAEGIKQQLQIYIDTQKTQ